jgi:hypothetical protein
MRYGKALAALLFAGLTAAASALTDEHITAPETIQVVIAVFTAGGVWLAPITPQWPWMKTAIAALLAGLNVTVAVIVGGLTAGELVNIGIAVVGVLAVAKSPGQSEVGLSARARPRD